MPRSLLRGRFTSDTVNVVFFFPYTFWNANCEVPKDTTLYGTSSSVYDMFNAHFLEVGWQLQRKFGGHQLRYVTVPENAAVDRDKIETIRILRACGVSTSIPVPYSSLNDILDSITPQRGVFIKCRYGAEGKGITVLHHGRWETNYRVDGDRLANYQVYGLWPFTEITGRQELLERLLEHEVIVEREILVPDFLPGRKFDVRAFVVGEEVPHFVFRVNSREKQVTNCAQGAYVVHREDTGLDQTAMDLIAQISRHAAQALQLRFVGIDIMFDGDLTNAKVVEAQAFPSLVGYPKTANIVIPYMISDASGLFI